MDAAGNTDSEWATVILRTCGGDESLRAEVEAIVKEIKRRTVRNVLDRQRLYQAAENFPDTLERLRQ